MKTRNIQSVFAGVFYILVLIIPSTLFAQHAQSESRNAHRKQKKANTQYVNNTHVKGTKQNKKKGYSYSKPAYKSSYQQRQHKHYNPYAYQQPNARYRAKKQYSAVYNCLPQKTRVVYLNGHKYYHHNNSYYLHNTTGGYVVVKPPRYINRVPQGAIKVNYRGHNAYMHGEIYFSWTPYGYIIL